MAQYDVLAICSEVEKSFIRIKNICEDFHFSFNHVVNVDQLMDGPPEFSESPFVLLSALSFLKEQEIAGHVQVVKQSNPDSYVVVIVDTRMEPSQLEFIKKSGANLVLLELEVLETSKLEYALSQKLRASFLPMKITELVPGKEVPCKLFHILPLNKKMIPVLHEKMELTDSKLKKLHDLGADEIYVRREHLALMQKYIKENTDLSAKGLASRCRAQFLSLMASYTDLVLLIMDQSELASYQKGKELYENCLNLAEDLLGSLSAVGEAWDIINNSSEGDFGSIERSPGVASYAGLLSLLSDFGTPKEVMIAALLADVGVLELNPKITQKMRNGQIDSLTAEEKKDYEKHPLISLNRCLNRKLPINEAIKNAILHSHERCDGKGYPNKIVSQKISNESKLIQLAELIDQESTLKMGQLRPQIKEVRKKIFQREFEEPNRFDMVFLMKLRDQMIN